MNDKAFAHPFVQRKLGTGNVEQLRLLISNDRLNQHTDWIREALKSLTGKEPEEDNPLANWASFVIHDKNWRQGLSFNLDVDSGDLYYDANDESELAVTTPPESLIPHSLPAKKPIWLDAKGQSK